jgi:hypothetical protein
MVVGRTWPKIKEKRTFLHYSRLVWETGSPSSWNVKDGNPELLSYPFSPNSFFVDLVLTAGISFLCPLLHSKQVLKGISKVSWENASQLADELRQ